MKHHKIIAITAMSLMTWMNAVKAGVLEKEFAAPPPSARPELFWDWMQDMVTKEGITHDLEAMKRAGFSGAMIMLIGAAESGFDPKHNMPNPVQCMSPEFFAHWKFAAEEANRLGLTLISQCGPGWCHSGGPWIKPEDAVQHLVSSKLNVTGPAPESAFYLAKAAEGGYSGYLATSPPKDEQKWVQIDLGREFPIERVVLHPVEFENQQGYGFPLRFRVEAATDPGFAKSVTLLDCTAEDMPSPGMAAVTAVGQGQMARYVRVVATGLKKKRPRDPSSPYCFALAQVQVFSSGKNVALNGKVSSKDSTEGFGWSMRSLVDGRCTGELKTERGEVIFPVPGAQDFTRDVSIVAYPKDKKEIQPGEIIELTQQVKGDILLWDVPAGEWTIHRIAMKDAKAYNRPPPKGGRGLECDKLSREANKRMFDGMVGRFIKDSPELAGRSIAGMEADSWEVGEPQWSADFRAEFQKRRGYDPLPWLVGHKGGPSVGSKQLAGRFATDLELTYGDVFADNFFSYLTDLCAQHGLSFMTEPYKGPFDPVRCGGRTARPMGEVWAKGECMNTIRWAASAANIYGRSLVGGETFTGRPIDGAWSIDPYALKRVGDLAFCHGLNKITIHGSALQPWGDKVKPGMPMGFWGSMVTPGQTWWEPGRAWITYLSRCQYMLQQGHAVADILTLFPSVHWRNSMGAKGSLHKLYNYDLCSEELLMKAEVKDGRIVLPNSKEGYRVLLLPQWRAGISLELLKKVAALVQAGGTVICSDRPTQALGLKNYPEADQEVQKLVSELWGACDGAKIKENRYGKGWLRWIPMGEESVDPEVDWVAKNQPGNFDPTQITRYWSEELRSVLRGLGAEPDVEVRTSGGPAQVFPGQDQTTCAPRSNEAAVAWIHRRSGDRDIYFLTSQVAAPMTAEITFRVEGKVPELWNAESGRVTGAAGWRSVGGRTALPLSFTPYGSVFVVFAPGKANAVQALTRDGQACPLDQMVRRGDSVEMDTGTAGAYKLTWASGRTAEAKVANVPHPIQLDGSWQVRFPKGWGAPAEARMELGSWTAHTDAGIKYFSGTATYEREFTLPADRVGGNWSHYLDLGKVKNLAEVTINGQAAGILWKPPFRMDITQYIKPGRNRMEVKVTNLWVNRMVGDEQHEDDCQWSAPRGQGGVPDVGRVITSIPDWVWTGGPRPQKERYTFTTFKFKVYNRDTPLLESGLLGPAKLETLRRLKFASAEASE